jgi:dGTPase
LLDHFGVLLRCPRGKFTDALNKDDNNVDKQSVLIERKLLSLFPEKHITAYFYACSQIPTASQSNNSTDGLVEWNLRAHLITDFISGMTDDFALASFQMLSGIKVN